MFNVLMNDFMNHTKKCLIGALIYLHNQIFYNNNQNKEIYIISAE